MSRIPEHEFLTHVAFIKQKVESALVNFKQSAVTRGHNAHPELTQLEADLIDAMNAILKIQNDDTTEPTEIPRK